MATDAFLQFTETGASGLTLNGETQDLSMMKLKPPPFEIENWSFAVNQTASIGSGTGGAGTGKASFDPFVVDKRVDTASPTCFLTCSAGGHFNLVTLFLRKAGGKATSGAQSQQVYLRFEFRMVGVSDIQWSHDDAGPKENITFVYGALRVTYVPQSQKGDLDYNNQKNTTWDQVNNEAAFDAGLGPVAWQGLKAAS